jgi:hypothetical protein
VKRAIVKRATVLAGWCTALVAALWALHGPMTPSAPTNWTLTGLDAYVSAHGPDAVIMAVVWETAVVSAWYLAVVTALGLVARVARAGRAAGVLDRLTVPTVRRLLGGWIAIGAATAPAASAWAAASTPSPIVMVMESAPGNAPITMTLEPPTSEAPASPPAPAVVVPVNQHVVQAGEHFWSIAEAHLVDITGRQPGPRDIARYWQRLVAANHSQLRVPSNPDLLYPGQRLVLPQAQ